MPDGGGPVSTGSVACGFKGHGESTALAERAFNLDCASELFDERTAEVQTQPRQLHQPPRQIAEDARL
jgi:hypothetical protein